MTAAQSSPLAQKDSATFDPDGTAHITRIVPMPATISPEAQKWLESLTHSTPGPETLAERRARTDVWRAQDSAEARKIYPVNVEEATVAGVRTDIITPLSMPAENRNRVLINLHGGGFNSDSGSLIEGVPISNLAKIKVVSVYYRLAPENPFPAAIDDVVAVYKELLKTYKPGSIGIFGTSAGAILTCEVTVRLKQLGLPLPGALGVFSGLADFSRPGDSWQLFTLSGFPGELKPTDANHLPDDQYVGKADRRDPGSVASLFGSHRISSEFAGDEFAGHFAEQHNDFSPGAVARRHDAQLVVFEALPTCLLVSLPTYRKRRKHWNSWRSFSMQRLRTLKLVRRTSDHPHSREISM